MAYENPSDGPEQKAPSEETGLTMTESDWASKRHIEDDLRHRFQYYGDSLQNPELLAQYLEWLDAGLNLLRDPNLKKFTSRHNIEFMARQAEILNWGGLYDEGREVADAAYEAMIDDQSLSDKEREMFIEWLSLIHPTSKPDVHEGAD